MIKTTLKGTQSPKHTTRHHNNNELIKQSSNSIQHGLFELIGVEFKKTHIKSLYSNPIWTERAFWIVVMAIEENTKNDIKTIIRSTREYLMDRKLPLPTIDWFFWLPKTCTQRYTVNLVRSTIQELEGDHDAVERQAFKNGISKETFSNAINHMKREGSIFESSDGVYRCL